MFFWANSRVGEGRTSQVSYNLDNKRQRVTNVNQLAMLIYQELAAVTIAATLW
jgi:hypothetical protein